jgi:hypothetical protein
MRRARVGLVLLVAVALMVVALTACGGDDDSASSATTNGGAGGLLTGNWSGVWKRTEPTPADGTVKLALQQSGTRVAGNFSVTSAACLTTHDIAGTVKGSKVELTVDALEASASFTGTVAGDTLAGTITVTCPSGTGKGTVRLRRA